jgi:TRAP-type C4-dicarboxylate transport system permease small subunit
VRRFNAAVERFGFALAGVLLLAITAITGFEVFAHKVTRQPPAWTTEVSVQAMVWMGLIGAAVCVRRGSHIAVEMVERHLPPSLRTAAAWLVTAGQVFVGGAFVIWGTLLAISLRGATTPGAKIPLSLSYLVLPISGVMIILFSIERRLSPPEPDDGR